MKSDFELEKKNEFVEKLEDFFGYLFPPNYVWVLTSCPFNFFILKFSVCFQFDFEKSG